MPVKETWTIPTKDGWRLVFIGRYYKDFATKEEAKTAEKNVLNILDTRGYSEAKELYIDNHYFRPLEEENGT